MKYSEKLDRLTKETAFAVTAVVNKLKAEGKDIVVFTVGEPDFNTPENIKNAGIKAIENNKTHYSSSNGIKELREVIASHISKTRNIPVHPDEVVVNPGGKSIIFYSILASINEGDEVLFPNPGYPAYESTANFAGAKTIPLPLVESKNFSFDTSMLKSLITPKTKMIILNSPHNPTGGMLGKKELEEIAEFAIKHDLLILSDEVYSKMIYEGEFCSISSLDGMKERTIILDGFSKTYAMTGWRLGYGIMNKELADYVNLLSMTNHSCTATFTQYAGIEALTGPQDEVDKMVSEFKVRRDLMVQGLNNIKGIKCHVPKSTFYVYPNVTDACRNLGFKNSKELQEYLLYKRGVAVLPRTCFGQKNVDENDEYIRLSYATSEEIIIEGLKRMKAAIEA